MANNFKFKLKKWISNKAEQCKNVAPLYSYALDRKLTLLERFRIRFHLLTCNACNSYVTNLNFMHNVFHVQEEQIEREKLHVTLSNEAKERIKKTLKS
ncbi:MAG TPA: zf-HC2 domain-containing protein [Pyrinomonadaceae bacterium]|nr:zf-HC2 domain-containing protein [Pyrinomonadaceae bacterium]